MAQKTILTCDLDDDGTEAIEVLRFSVGSDTYEIDVCESHLGSFHAAVAQFVELSRHTSGGRRTAARRSSAAPGRGRRSGRKATRGAVDSTAVREWARSNGYQISDRGRIPGAIVEAYRSA